ncbi:hypothetical protein, partial [Streptomyces sp. NPDC058548]|uniref:hypothetical protein n=1 Tax=unclassified Streptomyces TaxID=2593676 RepID=UPI0036631ABF
MLKPLARTLALTGPESSNLGGVILGPLVQKLFQPGWDESVPALVAQWLREGGIRVLTEEETEAALALDLARKQNLHEPNVRAIAELLKPASGLITPFLLSKATGYLEAGGYGMRAGLTSDHLMVVVALQEAAARDGRPVNASEIVREVLRKDPKKGHDWGRIGSWLIATRYLDSLGTPSLYTQFVRGVVARAKEMRQEDGAIDIADIAVDVFAWTGDDRSVPEVHQRAAVRFWLEEAQMTGLMDSGRGRSVPGGPPRQGAAMTIVVLASGQIPSHPSSSGLSARRQLADYVLWKAADLTIRRERVSLAKLTVDIFPTNVGGGGLGVSLVQAFLEVGGLGALVQRLDRNLAPNMATAFHLARAKLRRGDRVTAAAVLPLLNGVNPTRANQRVLDAWFRVVGLVGGPLDPNSLIGALKAAVLAFAAREKAAGREPQPRDAAMDVFDEEFPSHTQIAVAAEWLEEDPVRLYAVGLAHKELRAERRPDIDSVARAAFDGESTAERAQQVSDWLVGERLLEEHHTDAEEPVQTVEEPTSGGRDAGVRAQGAAGESPRQLAARAEALIYQGATLSVATASLEPFLPRELVSHLARTTTGLQGWVHRLMLQHMPTYRQHFELALPTIADPNRPTGNAFRESLHAFAGARGINSTVVDMWMRHYSEAVSLQNSLGSLDTRLMPTLEAEASTYVNARIGGVTLESRSAAQQMLHEERLMRVARKLLDEDRPGALAEADLIGRELLLPQQGRLVGGSSSSPEYMDYLRAVEAETAAMDSAPAESSTAAQARSSTRDESYAFPGVDPALRAYVEQTGSDGLWAGNTAEGWLAARGRPVLDGVTRALTADAVTALRPLATVLAEEQETQLGGVDLRTLAEKLFSIETLPWGWASLEQWLAQEGIRILTETELPIAKVVDIKRHHALNAPMLSPGDIGEWVFPEFERTRGAARVKSILEALGDPVRKPIPFRSMMVSIAAMMAAYHGGPPVPTSYIVADVLGKRPSSFKYGVRAEGWRDATLFYDSLAGSQSPYARFAATVVEIARRLTNPVGAVDVAQVAVWAFAEGYAVLRPTAEQRAAVRFWLEQAGFSGLMDSIDGDDPQPVRTFPPRNGLAQAIVKIVGQDTPAPPRWGERLSVGRRVDFAVWKAAELAARGQWFSTQDLVELVFPGVNAFATAGNEVAAYLEATGLQLFTRHDNPATAVMAMAFDKARDLLRAGNPVDVGIVADGLPSSAQGYLLASLESWLRAVGLVGGPLDPGGVVGRIRGAVRELAAANPYMSVEDLVRRVFK